MATNSFDALVVDINKKISEMNTATSNANGAASNARNAVTAAETATQNANAAAAEANSAASNANTEADAWDKATASATTVSAGGSASVKLEEKNGAKSLTFGIPAGATGPKGDKGATGRSGVTFTLSGSALYITTG